MMQLVALTSSVAGKSFASLLSLCLLSTVLHFTSVSKNRPLRFRQ